MTFFMMLSCGEGFWEARRPRRLGDTAAGGGTGGRVREDACFRVRLDETEQAGDEQAHVGPVGGEEHDRHVTEQEQPHIGKDFHEIDLADPYPEIEQAA